MENLVFTGKTADWFVRERYCWSVLATPRGTISHGDDGVADGCNLRVGLEDGLFMSRGGLPERVAQRAARIWQIVSI